MSAAANPGGQTDQPGGTPSPQRTYALVVGIERYDAGPSWDLDGPARDAARFASWLADCGVPADQMLVFLSPLDQETVGVDLPRGIAVESARQGPVTEAITRKLSEWRGDLLWLFWAGHGALTRDDGLRLFYADASTNDKRNLDLHSLFTALRTDLYAGLSRQAGLIDACQLYAERLQFAATLPHETFPCGQPLPSSEQFLLIAASPGQAATNLGSTRGGLFSQMVMEELTERNAQGCFPDMDHIASRLEKRFSELRAAGRTSQTPTSFRWRTWTGGEHVLGETHFASAGAEVAIIRRPPSESALSELVERLLEVDVVADPGNRMRIINRLPKGLATSIHYAASSRPHVVNIITRCLEYVDGLAKLIEAVKLYADPEERAVAQAEEAARRLSQETGQQWTFGQAGRTRDQTATAWQAPDESARPETGGDRSAIGDDREGPRYLVGDNDIASATLSPHDRSLLDLGDALERILPIIFQDPRIRRSELEAAHKALGSVGPLMAALSAAANEETRQPMRHDLQRLDGALREHHKVVSQKLSALGKVRSETAARKLCDALAEEAVQLLDAGRQAIRRVT